MAISLVSQACAKYVCNIPYTWRPGDTSLLDQKLFILAADYLATLALILIPLIELDIGNISPTTAYTLVVLGGSYGLICVIATIQLMAEAHREKALARCCVYSICSFITCWMRH